MACRDLEGIIFDGETFYGNNVHRPSRGSQELLSSARKQIGKIGLVIPSASYLERNSLRALAEQKISYGDLARPMVDVVAEAEDLQEGWQLPFYSGLIREMGTVTADTMVVTPRYKVAAAAKELGTQVVAIVTPKGLERVRELELERVFLATGSLGELNQFIYTRTGADLAN